LEIAVTVARGELGCRPDDAKAKDKEVDEFFVAADCDQFDKVISHGAQVPAHQHLGSCTSYVGLWVLWPTPLIWGSGARLGSVYLSIPIPAFNELYASLYIAYILHVIQSTK
jgi:hypothetical protein